MVAEVQTGSVRDYPAYLHFTPRPDQPEKWDEQTGFYESKSDGVAFMIGGNGAGTTSCLIAKICRFVLETPPPRRDTPFWIVGESYQQICSLFDEKVDQQGHLPPHVVDRERIQWYKVNNNWPFRVPLKSPPGYPGKNWCLEFKSWRQGRGQMQARSLGGFGFIEQFPWGVFEEVLRGCREYNFPGSKLVEYTPVDPDMSVDLEEMLESGYEPENGREPGRRYLPRNWKIYHANTACAAEAGHVDRGWFEEFFGMVPEDMLDTRMKGLFSTFEGVIYKGFSTEVHCMGDEMWPRIRYCPHRRGIDWGAGPENDFACAWGARNGLGQWFVYDSHSSNDQLKTTVDHLSDVYEQWEWPEDNSLYGTTYADPSSPDNIRIAGKMRTYNPAIGNFSIQRGRNSVLEGIEHIQYLLKPQVPVPVVGLDGKPKLDANGNQIIKLEPKLFFHRQNCAKLIGQMKTYRWLRGADPSTKASRNPRDPARQPLKKNDHLCLAGDTPINMADGTLKPIRDVSVGDKVLSHLGVTTVVATQCTGIRKLHLFLGTTQIIRCTQEHPWYDFASGVYYPVHEVLSLCKLNNTPTDPEHSSKLPTGVDINGGDTRTQDMIQSEATSGAAHEMERTGNCATTGCTKKCGNRSTEISQNTMRSITSTVTPQTTPSKTCSLSQSHSTQEFIKETSLRLSTQLKTGTAAKKEGNGILSTQGKSTQTERQKHAHASTVTVNTKHATQDAVLNTVPVNAAHTPGDHEVTTITQEHASCAENYSPCVNTRRNLPVQVPVQEYECQILPNRDELGSVYNLATEDGTYFADGILTSNCDALRYMCFSDDFMSGSTISSATFRSGLNTQLDGHYLPTGDIRHIRTDHRGRN